MLYFNSKKSLTALSLVLSFSTSFMTKEASASPGGDEVSSGTFPSSKGGRSISINEKKGKEKERNTESPTETSRVSPTIVMHIESPEYSEEEYEDTEDDANPSRSPSEGCSHWSSEHLLENETNTKATGETKSRVIGENEEATDAPQTMESTFSGLPPEVAQQILFFALNPSLNYQEAFDTYNTLRLVSKRTHSLIDAWSQSNTQIADVISVCREFPSFLSWVDNVLKQVSRLEKEEFLAYTSLDGSQRFVGIGQSMGYEEKRTYVDWVEDTGGCNRELLLSIGGGTTVKVIQAISSWEIHNGTPSKWDIANPDSSMGSIGCSLLTNRLTGLQLLGKVEPQSLTPELVRAFDVFNDYVALHNDYWHGHNLYTGHSLYTALLQVDRSHINDNFIDTCRTIFDVVKGERFAADPKYIAATVRDIGRLKPEFVNSDFTGFANALATSLPEVPRGGLIGTERAVAAVRVACMVDAADRKKFAMSYAMKARGGGAERVALMEHLLDEFYLPEDFDPSTFLGMHPDIDRAEDERELEPAEFARRLYLRVGRRAGLAYKPDDSNS